MMRYIIITLVLSSLVLIVFPTNIPNTLPPVVEVIVEKSEFEGSEINCLAQNIFFESLNEPYEGKLAVATVTMNRVRNKQYPNSICEVVFQKNDVGCQFSWTCGARTRFEPHLFNETYILAEKFLNDNLELDILKDALFFHASYVNPRWPYAKQIEQIGNHIFYELADGA